MKAFTAPLFEYREFSKAKKEIEEGQTPIQLTGCIDSQKCHVMYALAEEYPFRLIVTYNELKAKEMYEDFKLFDRDVMLYPAKDVIFYNADIHGHAIVQQRLKVIKRLIERQPVTVIVSLEAGMDKILAPELIAQNICYIRESEELNTQRFQEILVSLGYERQAQVEAPGDFAVRGGIFDIFPLTEEVPYRIELWGDEIDSIRSFDITNQRSIERVPSISIYPAAEIVLDQATLQKGLLTIEKEAKAHDKKLHVITSYSIHYTKLYEADFMSLLRP